MKALLVRHRESSGQSLDAALATRSGVEAERLAERRLSPAPIATWREVVERAFRDPDFAVTGGESGSETFARGWAAIRRLLLLGQVAGRLASLALDGLPSGRIWPAFVAEVLGGVALLAIRPDTRAPAR